MASWGRGYWEYRTPEQVQPKMSAAVLLWLLISLKVMLDRNRFLVDHASMLLAVYNGVRRSGTGATVNYARKQGREIIVIDPLTLSVTHEGGKL